MPYMEKHDNDPIPTMLLQRIPAELLPKMMFLKQHEMPEDFE